MRFDLAQGFNDFPDRVNGVEKISMENVHPQACPYLGWVLWRKDAVSPFIATTLSPERHQKQHILTVQYDWIMTSMIFILATVLW